MIRNYGDKKNKIQSQNSVKKSPPPAINWLFVDATLDTDWKILLAMLGTFLMGLCSIWLGHLRAKMILLVRQSGAHQQSSANSQRSSANSPKYPQHNDNVAAAPPENEHNHYVSLQNKDDHAKTSTPMPMAPAKPKLDCCTGMYG